MYLHWIYNFAEIDPLSEEKQICSGRNWYYLCFLAQKMTGYKSSLCWGISAEPRVCILGPWKGLGITTRGSAQCSCHLRLNSAHSAWVPCPIFPYDSSRTYGTSPSWGPLASICSHITLALTTPSPPVLMPRWLLLPNHWSIPGSSSQAIDEMLLWLL